MNSKKVVLNYAVLRALAGELEYQNQMAGTERADDVDHGVPGQILTMIEYLSQAGSAWVLNRGDQEALGVLRKVVTTGLRALIVHGCPVRPGYPGNDPDEDWNVALQKAEHRVVDSTKLEYLKSRFVLIRRN